MNHEKEKSVLVHWYYSVSEWEEFISQGKRRPLLTLVSEAIAGWLLAFMVIRFGRGSAWVPALAVSGNIAIIYAVVKYYINAQRSKWKGHKMPEISIIDGTVTVNGKSTIFQGNGVWLRKADIKEKDNFNVLEIGYEWKTGKDMCFDEIEILVPKGKLREAVELLDCLNLRRDLLVMLA